MSVKNCDVLISGGGIAGLTAAAAFGSAGFRVVCVDPAPPVTRKDAKGADLRSTALMQPARKLLETAGLWPHLAPHAAPLQVMRIIDAGGETAQARVIKDFSASDISDQPFGWNFPNYVLRRALLSRLNDLPMVDFRPGIATRHIFTRSQMATVTLSDDSKLHARLVIAADGRHSALRKAAGIGVSTTRYGQKALAFAVTHPVPHENVSVEIHRTGGPFTLVPLPDHNGLPCSAVVWMDEGPKSGQRLTQDIADFEKEMSQRSCYHFGPLTLVSKRSLWPIISQRARSLYARRLALIAEAAHVVPPIGAQGLNMSLRDLDSLLALAQERPQELGDTKMLEAYEAARMGDIKLRVRGIDLLNRASHMSTPALRDARALGLNALYHTAPLRKMLMQMGLGAGKR